MARIFKNYFLLKDNYHIVLVSAIHQHGSTIGIHMPPSSGTSLLPSIPSHSSRLSQSSGLSSLSHIANSHWLSIFYMLPHYSLHLSHPLLTPMSISHSLRLRLHRCSANGLSSTMFLDFIYMSSYTIFVFLFLTYFTL